MMANNFLVAWDRIIKDFIDRTWSIYQIGRGEDASDDKEPNADDGNFRLQMTQLDLEDRG
jgi:hypothetical protein